MPEELTMRIVLDQGKVPSPREGQDVAQRVADALSELGITVLKTSHRGISIKVPAAVYEALEMYDAESGAASLPNDFSEELAAYVRTVYIPTKPEFF
ncbi:hypothetical protein HYS49_01075 [Candidatus Woesearchaeota archaeon]|nr:hypothetical protein [Candidatus Woesearchaeota archaeon]